MSEAESTVRFNNRPHSVIAQNFALDLDSVFGLDSQSERAQVVEEKKRELSSREAELEALEARLRATEERLNVRKPGWTPKPLKNDQADGNTVADSRKEQDSNGSTTQQTVVSDASDKAGVPLVPVNHQGKKAPAVEEDSDEEGEDTEEDDEDDEDEDTSEESSSEEGGKWHRVANVQPRAS